MRSPIRYIGAMASAARRQAKNPPPNPSPADENLSKDEFYDRISKGKCGMCGGDGGGDSICDECKHS